jgi:hypothetical protein
MSRPLTRDRLAGTSIATLVLALGWIVVLHSGPWAAGAEAGDQRAESARQVTSSALLSHRLGKPTGTRVHVDYFNPADSTAKPPAVRRVEIRDPRGTKIDTSVPERCEASDAELMVVGDGFLRLDTGVPGPERMIEADILLLNQADELIFLSTIRGSGARVVTRASVKGRTVAIDVPLLPGTPPDGAAIDEAETNLEQISTAAGDYIRTPRTCPPRGFWTIRHRFVYDDGVTQIARSRTACREGRP